MYSSRTSATRSSSSSSDQPATWIGGCTTTSTVPERAICESRHISSPEFRSTRGTTGTPASMAIRNAPFLKRPTVGVTDRVPSGAMMTEMPWRSFSTAGARASTALAVLERSTKMTSARRNSCPKTGRLEISFLATKVKSRSRSRKATTMSITLLWWLRMKTAGRCDQRCSPPCTSIEMLPTAGASCP